MEKRVFSLPGFAVLSGGLAFAGAVTLFIIWDKGSPMSWALVAAAVMLGLLLASGFTIVSPNEARVVQFFGRYIGTLNQAGFHWVAPLTFKRLVSQRVRNFETSVLKVNDAEGNPVEIAAVVVFRVTEPATAIFGVDDYYQYVETQSETAVRHLATTYAYDTYDSGDVSLRDGAQISEELTTELCTRVQAAGVEVIETRITHLAYAPEIAQAMLQRQQASAIVAARSRIVEGAVGMVQLALQQLREQGVVELDEERKAAMVSNLLVVLCGDRSTQPVVNAGSLYG
ncbi:MAG: SPFH domain-containing protein [Longispora sp.]|nr:SPFH domain-containing protein [Longispora sp. (in: high G+C Gram-positive bacteria)]